MLPPYFLQFIWYLCHELVVHSYLLSAANIKIVGDISDSGACQYYVVRIDKSLFKLIKTKVCGDTRIWI